MRPYAFSGVLFANMLIFGFLGYFIDTHLHTLPLFLLIGLLYSVIGSIFLLIKKTRYNDE